LSIENHQLIIGYGNPLRSDDGVGQVVAAEIAAGQANLSTIACHQLLPEHAEAISQAGRVIFVDAAVGSEPGKITVQPVEPCAAGSAGRIHDFTPATLMAYAQRLYGHAPPATLVTVQGFSFAYSESLSGGMTAVLPELLARISALLHYR
jgi:hydrogenase maturation protease